MKEKELTIGMFVDTFFPMTDGVAMVVDNYAKRLRKRARVIVFAPSIRGMKYDDSVFPYEVVRCKSLKLPFIDYSLPIPKMDLSFYKSLKKYHLDIVHIHSPFTIGEAGVKYAKKNKIPVVGTMHSQYKQDFLRAVRNEKLANALLKKVVRVFNKCDACFTVNSEIARIYHDEYAYKAIPKIIPNATDMDLIIDSKSACDLINKRHNIKKKEKVLLFVGRINKLKNVFFIVQALNELVKMIPDFKFKMLFIGTGQDEKELKNLVEKLGLNKKIIFCGKVTDRNLLASYYNRADLFLFPSFYDTNSLVQLEAASQKTPTLFLKGSATSATVTDNVNGFIEENDATLYAKRIIKILDDKKRYQEVSENAYRDLYKNWDNVIDDVYSQYMKLISKTNR